MSNDPRQSKHPHPTLSWGNGKEEMPSPSRRSTRSIAATAVCVGVLLIAYAIVAAFAASEHSPTYDEPMHELSAQIALRDRDFRIHFENPPLWDYFVALPGVALPLNVNPPNSLWDRLPGNTMLEWPYMMRTWYRTAGNDPDALIRRSRGMCLLIAGACGAIVALWAFQLRGPVAAVAATAIFALDPNLLAHGPVVKNDVVVALIFVLGAMIVWRAGQRLTIGRLVGLGAVCAAACTCKLSGVLLPPVLVGLLLLRALLGEPWLAFGRSIDTRRQRMIVAGGASAAMFAMTIAGIWTVYGFRFSAIPGGPPLAAGRLFGTVDAAWHAAGHDGNATDRPSMRAAKLALDYHLLPEAFIDGGLYIYATTLDRPGYLLGEVRHHGWWDYYPLAIVFKFPLATMAAIAMAALQACSVGFGRSSFSTRLDDVVPTAATKHLLPRCDGYGHCGWNQAPVSDFSRAVHRPRPRGSDGVATSIWESGCLYNDRLTRD